MPSVRSAVASDNAQIRRIVQASLADFGIDAEFEGLDAAIGFAGLPTSKNAIELVAVYAGEICGCLAVQDRPQMLPMPEIRERQGKLFGFHVGHQCRGKGIGRALLMHAVQMAKLLGYTSLYLDTWDSMRSAIKLYEAMGWVAAANPSPESGANRAYVLKLV